MKNHFRKISLIALLLFSCIALLPAADIIWNGGMGNWDDPANWDTGTIPTANDHVYIKSGRVSIYTTTYAISTEVSAGARLVIYSGGHLRLAGAVNRPALTNAGRVYILGVLRIATVTSPNGNNGKGIYNTDGLYIYQNAALRISGIADYAIDNRAPGFVSNNGNTRIDGLFSHGIFNTGIFRNYRDISIYANITNQSYGVHNLGDFRNYHNGDIYLGYGYYGFVNNSGASLNNYGTLSSYDAQNTGINNAGYIHNQSTGILRANGSLSKGLTNASNGVIDNHNLIECTESENTGMRSSGVINNYSALVVNSFQIMGMYLTNGSVLNNYKTLSIGQSSISNPLYGSNIRGDLFNHENGVMSTDEKIYVVGKLQNYGYMNLSYDGNHTMSSGAEFNNYSVIDDNFNALPSGVNNEKLIIHPVSGIMETGVPFDDVLEVASLDGITISTWKGSPTNNTSVGTYDPNTNSFTPNVNAQGLTTIYIGINNGGSLSRNHTLELYNPVENLNEQDASAFKIGNSDEAIRSEQELAIYPNPSAGTITIESKAFENAPTRIQVRNTVGQMVWQELIPAGSAAQAIQLPNELANGMYLIHLLQNEVNVGVEKIQLQR